MAEQNEALSAWQQAYNRNKKGTGFGNQGGQPAKGAQPAPVTDQTIAEVLAKGANGLIPGRAAIGQQLNKSMGNPTATVDPNSAGGNFANSLVDFINTLFAADVGKSKESE